MRTNDRVQRPVNFRDLGGIQTNDGRQLAGRRLLRSGEPVGLTDAEEKRLVNDYDLTMIVDFRTKGEAEDSPVKVPRGVEYRLLDLYEKNPEGAAAMGNFELVKTPEQARDFMYQMYESVVADTTTHKQLKQFVDIVRDHSRGALLYHCYAGKDRTGVATAILLTLMNVPRESIIKDYLVTNRLRQEWNDKEYAKAKAAGAGQTELDVMDTVFYVQEAYIQHTFQRADEVYGSFENYIFDGLDVTQEDAKKIQQNYLISV